MQKVCDKKKKPNILKQIGPASAPSLLPELPHTDKKLLQGTKGTVLSFKLHSREGTVPGQQRSDSEACQ